MPRCHARTPANPTAITAKMSTSGEFDTEFMPNDKIGVIVLVISDHSAPLYNIVGYNIYERLLGMDQTPWSERQLKMRLANKKAGTEARAKAGADRVTNTKPSHALADYAAEYESPAYGIVKISQKSDALQF